MGKESVLGGMGGRAVALVVLILGTAEAYADPVTWSQVRSLPNAELTALAETGADPSARARAMLTLADRSINTSIEEATRLLEAAEGLLTSADPDRSVEDEIFTVALRCQIEHRQGLAGAEAACLPLKRSRPSGEQLDPVVRSYIHLSRAYLYYREGQHEVSMREAEEGLRIARDIRDHGHIAVGNNIMGVHFATRLLPRMALTHLETAWEAAGRLPYTTLKQQIQLNLAAVYSFLGRHQDALQLLDEVQHSQLVLMFPTRELVVQSTRAIALSGLSKAEEGQATVQAALDRVHDDVLPDARTFAYTALGVAELALDRPQSALGSFDRVLEITQRSLRDGLDHPRVQPIVVPYARALRRAGSGQEAIALLETVVARIPESQPDQLLVDAYDELASSRQAAGDDAGASLAEGKASELRKRLWDASFEYRIARLNAALESDRRNVALARARERETALKEQAEHETTLLRLSWLIAGLLIAFVLLFQSRRMQKRMASTERASNERLEQLVRRRTRELEEQMAQRMQADQERRELSDRLAEAEKMRALGQLTAGVAHDFNNLMTVVTLTAEHLKTMDGQRDAEEKQLLDDILAAADSGAKITDGLLSYVRKKPLQPEVLELDEFLRDALPLFRNTLGESYQLKVDLEPAIALVDKGQLTTSILNLILNAREAMPEPGTVELSLSTDEQRAQIRVRDPGTGMSEQACTRAFEPFFTTKGGGEGTGLGLSMVYGFARQSGGNLHIDSAVGRGTTVTLTLPLLSESAIAPELVNLPSPSFDPSLQALVVEDQETLLTMLSKTLEQLGLNVTRARTAREALNIVAAQGSPDLLVSDVLMPGGMDGRELAERLRQHNPDLPILLISGYTDAVSTDCLFLRKPFSITELEQAVAQAIAEVGARADANAELTSDSR